MGSSIISKLLILILFTLFISCECPPGIDTPKDIEPTEFSSVAFVNCIYDYSNIEIIASNKTVYDNFFKNENSYNKIPAGINNFRILYNNKNVFNSIFNIIKDIHCSIYFYNSTPVRSVVLIDSSSNHSPAHYRFINIYNFDSNLTFEFQGLSSTNTSLSYENYTNLISIEPGNYTLIIADTDTGDTILTRDVNIDNSMNYTFAAISDDFEDVYLKTIAIPFP